MVNACYLKDAASDQSTAKNVIIKLCRHSTSKKTIYLTIHSIVHLKFNLKKASYSWWQDKTKSCRFTAMEKTKGLWRAEEGRKNSEYVLLKLCQGYGNSLEERNGSTQTTLTLKFPIEIKIFRILLFNLKYRYLVWLAEIVTIILRSATELMVLGRI